MSVKSLLRPNNARIRLAVGAGVLVMICMQCTRTSQGFKDTQFVTGVGGRLVGQNSAGMDSRIEQLARTDQIALLKMCLERLDATVQDYRCTFVKQERIRGQVTDEQVAQVKFRQKPFSVMMQWVRTSTPADRTLYVEGLYDGQMLVKPKGLFALAGTVKRSPTDPDVMESTLRPITQFGFRRMLESLLEVYEEANRCGELEFSYLGTGRIEGIDRDLLVIQRVLPPREGYPAKTTRIYIDRQLLLPVQMDAWNWQDELSSRYTFRDIQLNVGLTDADFVPANNGM